MPIDPPELIRPIKAPQWVELLSDEFLSDRYTQFQKLHEIGSLFSWGEGRWLVCGYDDVVHLLRRSELIKPPIFSKNFRNNLPPEDFRKKAFDLQDQIISFINPPSHSRIRQVLRQAFSREFIFSQQPRMEQLAHKLLSTALLDTECEIIENFVRPFTYTIISELVGFPPIDKRVVNDWTNIGLVFIEGTNSETIRDKAHQDFLLLIEQCKDIYHLRMQHPEEDVISHLIALKQGGADISENEIIANAAFLLLAGHETLVSWIGNGFKFLLENPELVKHLEAYPEDLYAASHEMLRLEVPIQLSVREFGSEVFYNKHHFSRGDVVTFLLGAANRDPKIYEQPNTISLQHKPSVLSFGAGPHYCLGAELAELEASIAFRIFLPKVKNYRITQEPQFLRSSVVRTLTQLTVAQERPR